MPSEKQSKQLKTKPSVNIWTAVRNKFLKIKNLLTGRPVWQIPTGHVITPAFISEGVQYYCLADNFNTFSQRGMAGLTYYEEYNMRMTKDDLLVYIKRIEDTVNNNKEIRIGDIITVIGIMRQRVSWPIGEEDLFWRMLSVKYFDRNESPYYYDPEYNKTKIERWKKAKDIDLAFFFDRERDWLKLPSMSADVLKGCLTVIEEMKKSEKIVLNGLGK